MITKQTKLIKIMSLYPRNAETEMIMKQTKLIKIMFLYLRNAETEMIMKQTNSKLIKIMSGFKQTVSGNRSPSFFRSKMLFGVLRRCL